MQGASLEPNRTMLITEYCEGGNLARNLMAGRVDWYRRGKRVSARIACTACTACTAQRSPATNPGACLLHPQLTPMVVCASLRTTCGVQLAVTGVWWSVW